MERLRPIGISITLVLLLFVGGGECTDSQTEELATGWQVAGAVILLVCLIGLLALCVKSAVQTANPLPAWVSIIQVDPAIDTGYMSCSDGMNIVNPNTVLRHRRGNFETDGAKWGAPLSKGKHVFEIHWPAGMRGQLATVGVATESAPLFVKPRDSLVGCNSQSWGFDIVRRRTLHKKVLDRAAMPRQGFVPEKFYMYVDCDSGTVGFGCETLYWGAPHLIPKHAFPVYAMVGVCHPNAQVAMIYRGSENRNLVKGPPVPTNTVVVPSQAPGGQVHVTVINPGVVQTQHPGPGPSGYANPPPIAMPVAPGHVEAPPPYQEKPDAAQGQQYPPPQQPYPVPGQAYPPPQQPGSYPPPDQQGAIPGQAYPPPEQQGGAQGQQPVLPPELQGGAQGQQVPPPVQQVPPPVQQVPPQGQEVPPQQPSDQPEKQPL